MYNNLYLSGILEYSIFGFPLVSLLHHERNIVKSRLYVWSKKTEMIEW